MIENNETIHRDGRAKREILTLFESIDKEQADKDRAGLRLPEGRICALLSESCLKKDWLKPEEDEAWREL